MPPRRLVPLDAPVHLIVDGDRVPARDGEPVAVALAAAGRLTLCRSAKYHRPRGAVCYSGRCDGCLMRVDGVASVMTCRLPARDAMVITTQNVVGSAKRDLLAATDWFFPGGMNHHEMFTWNDAVNKVMQKVARRIAGIGTLPDAPDPPRASSTREVDVLVIGGGPAGLRAASECARGGRSVVLVDEEPQAGGSLAWWPGEIERDAGSGSASALAAELVAEAKAAGVELVSRTSAVGFYDPWEDVEGAGDPPIPAPARREGRAVVIADGPHRITRFRPLRTIVATGRHEGASAFANADRPGVLGLRGACVLMSRGVLPGERVVLAGAGPGLVALASALREAGAKVLGPYPESAIIEAEGGTRVERCELEIGGKRKVEACDAIVVATATSATYELAAQAGVAMGWSGTGFELEAGSDDGATAAPDVRVIGWAAGVDSLDAALAQAEAAGRAIHAELAP